MSSLTGESIDSFARQLGARRLRLDFPWEQQPLKDVFSGFSSEISVFQPPDWIDQPPVKFWTAASVGSTDEKHFGFKHARMRLSQISWTEKVALCFTVLEDHCAGKHDAHQAWTEVVRLFGT